MIADDVVERVKEEADIVQIIGEHVALKRVGADYRGPCPFHQGTHPNFSVSPKKHMYYCFVCHEGGDVFTFLSKRLGLDWPSAVRLAAEKSGIEIPIVDVRRAGPDPREPLWEVTASAAEYFRRMLWDDDGGRGAREYLRSRGIDRETADRFGIGYAPTPIGLMRTYLQTLGFDDARQLEAGLLSQPEEGREPRPRFRGRLIFPIFDAVGHTVGFGGRILGAGDVKYVNSPESSIFAKRRLLYGLNWAKFAIRREERVLVVEGYFDVVRLMAAGVEPVVAPLGTALTAEQAELIARYTKQAFLIYDNDKAGLRATFRTAGELLRRSVAVRVVNLPEGEDPDTFVNSQGREQLEAQVRAAVDVFEREIQILQSANWFRDLHTKRRAIDRLLPTIRAAADPILRDLYVTRASEVSGVPKALLWREVGGEVVVPIPPRADAAEARATRSVRARGGRHENGTPDAFGGVAAERELVRWLLASPGEVERVAARIAASQIRDAVLREIYEALLRSEAGATAEAVCGVVSPPAAAEVTALVAGTFSGADPARVIDDSLAVLRVRDLSDRLAEIDRLVGLGSREEQRALMTEKLRIMAEVRELRGRGFKRYGKARLSLRRNDGAP
jgi:DNA primase